MYLGTKLNFTVKTDMPKKRHSWAYLVQQIGEGTYDIGETAFTFTQSRTDIVDFSFGMMPLTYTLAYVPNTNLLQLQLFLQPFKTFTWLAVLVYVALVIIVGSYFGLTFGTSPNPSILEKLKNILPKIINFALRTVIGKRIGSEPSLNSTKVAFVLLIINGFLLITCYRALLVASLTANFKSPPINTLKELKDSKYLLGVQEGSNLETVLQTAENEDSDEYQLRKNKKIISQPGSQTEMLENIANDATRANNFVFFIEKQVLQFHDYFPCRLSDIETAERRSQGISGMIYRKNWPFKELLNHQLLVMKQSGVMDKLYHPYLRKTKKICPNQQIIKRIINKPNPVTINATFSLYLLIFIGLIVSFACLSIEIVYYRHVTNWFTQKIKP